jgi:hypothetical protein
VPGFSKVLQLARFLATMHDQQKPMSTKQIDSLVKLWNNLHSYDKKKTIFEAQFAKSPGPGRFKATRTQNVTEGVTSVKR